MLHKRFTILGLMLACGQLIAQTDKSGKIETQEIIIIKDYKVNLEEASKINFSPKTPPAENFKTDKLTYNIPTKLKQLDFEPKPVQTLSYTKVADEKTYESHIKAGFGTQISPLLNILHNQLFSKDLRFKLGVNHLSANRSDLTSKWQRYFTNEFFTGLDFQNKKISVQPYAKFTHNHNNFYAPDLPLSEEGKYDIGRNYQWFNFNNKIDYYGFKNGWRIFNNVRMDYLKDNINNENKDSLKKQYNEYRYGGDVTVEKKFNNMHQLQFMVGADIAQTNDMLKTHRNIVATQLKYNLDMTKIGFKLMAGLNYTNETGKSHLLPLLETEKNLIETKLIFFTGWNIKLQQSYYFQIIQQNPFVYYSGSILNTKVDNRYAGFKGAINRFTYQALFSNRQITNLPIYTTDSANSRLFHLTYESRLTMNNLHVDVSYKPNEAWTLGFLGDVYLYEPTTIKRAWNMPMVDLDFQTKYRLSDKIDLNADFFIKQGIFVQNSSGLEEQVPIILDLNLGGSYYFKKNLSFFINLNNLASQRYRLWYGYPYYGIQAFAGIKFSC